MSKADKDGWIRHNSKQQPFDDHVEVEVRTRGGDYEICEASGFAWNATGENQIMAYRLHKQAEQVEACSKPELRSLPENYGEIIGGSVEGPIQWRDRITEIDATTQALTTERAELVQKLASEGFALIERINELLTDAAQKHEDMSDWRNWKAGDVVRYEGLPDFHSRYFTIGNLYEIKVVEAGDDRKNIYNPVIFKADDSGEENGWRPELFKFHPRPSA